MVGADTSYMGSLRRGIEIGTASVVRGAGLYLFFYLYIFVLIPLTLAMESLLPMPLWSLVAIYTTIIFSMELISMWPQDRLEPVPLSGPRTSMVGSGRREIGPRRPRIRAVCGAASVVATVHRPLHRQVRFGRTRLR